MILIHGLPKNEVVHMFPYLTSGSEEGLLPGVEEAILKMCSGEKAQIFIFPGKWGFGKSGKPEFGIPENASLEYVIHLKKFENVSLCKKK